MSDDKTYTTASFSGNNNAVLILGHLWVGDGEGDWTCQFCGETRLVNTVAGDHPCPGNLRGNSEEADN